MLFFLMILGVGNPGGHRKGVLLGLNLLDDLSTLVSGAYAAKARTAEASWSGFIWAKKNSIESSHYHCNGDIILSF